VIGLLDDLILVPLGFALALKLIPALIMVDCRLQADVAQGLPVSRSAPSSSSSSGSL